MWRKFVGTNGLILPLLFILTTSGANALDSLSLNIGSIAGTQWQLGNVNIVLGNLAQKPQKLALTITRLSLPKPFDDLNLVNIHCTSFSWQNKELLCKQGRAEMHSKRWQSPFVNFSFQVTEKHSSFKLSDLHLAGGTITVEGDEQGESWRLQINAKEMDGKVIQQLFPQKIFKLRDGKIDIELTASGSHARIEDLTLIAELNGLT
ncbi:MAG: C4-dicarboxylate ABC transporter, partial [Gammaproteobacteria bacterium]